MTTKEVTKHNKTFEGIVLSDKMDKTVVVRVNRFVKHPKYGKYYKVSKNIKAHDPQNRFRAGEKVKIVETLPVSKGKSFKVIYT